jgi:VCBS repeat-containing protein
MAASTHISAGVVSQLEGLVRVMRAGGKSAGSLKVGDALGSGDEIVAAAGARIEVTDANGQFLQARVGAAIGETHFGVVPQVDVAPSARVKAETGLDLVVARLDEGAEDDAPAAGLNSGVAGALAEGLRVERVQEAVGTQEFAYDPASIGVTREPVLNAGMSGEASTVGKGSESTGGSSDTNSAPVIVIGGGDSHSTNEDTPVSGQVVASDADGNPLSYTAGTAPAHGSVTVNPDGTWTYTPGSNFNGTDVFTVTISDGQGGISTATVNVGVTAVNDVPVASADSASVLEGGSVVINLVSNDGDVEGALDPASIVITNAPTHGTVSVNANGTVSYQHDGSETAADSFSYTVKDAQGLVSAPVNVSVSVTGVNDLPVVDTGSANFDVATGAYSHSTTEDTPVSGQVVASDADGNPLSYTAGTAPAHGSVTVNPDGTWTYTPGSNFNGSDSFTVAISDGQGGISTATVNVGVTAVNDAPVASADSASVLEGGSVVINLVSNDGDVEGALDPASIVITSAPTHGTVSVNANGTVSYQHDGSETAADSFSYTVKDAQGLVSAPVNVSIAVTGSNDLPVVDTGSANFDPVTGSYQHSTTEDTPVSGQVVASDADGNPLSYTAGTAPAHGSVTINPDGTWTYTPGSNFNGTDVFTVTISDGQGGISTATVNVGVTAVNDAPVASADSASVLEGGSVVINLVSNDGDVEGALDPASIVITSAPTHGTVSVNANGTVSYQHNGSETAADSFSYTVKDAQGLVSAPVNVSVSVTGVNDLPVVDTGSANFDVATGAYSHSTNEDTPVSGQVVASDADGNPLSYTAGTSPAHGSVTVNPDGTWTYTPGSNFNGTDVFTVTISDGQGGISTATVNVGVTAVNDAPVANNDSLSTTEDTAVTYTAAQLLGNDTDIDSATLSIASVASGSGGSAVLNADGSVTFTPNAHFNGTADFSYIVTDGTSNSTPATATVQVAAINDAPVASADSASVLEGGSVVINLVSNDGDVEGALDPASIVITSAPTHGTVSVNANGTVSYQHDGSETAADSFSYTVKDAQGLVSAPVNVSIAVTGSNDLPVVDTGSANFDPVTGSYQHSTTEDTPVSGQVVASDADGNPLSYTAGTAPAHGSVTINPDGTWTYTPGSNFNGTDVFTVTISDGQGGISTATVNVGVTAVNDVPVASADSASVLEGGSVVINLVSNDGDVEGALDPASIVITSAPTHGTVSVNANGTVSYQHNGSETAADSFSYTVKDAQGLVSAPVNVSVSVTGVNDLPVVDTGSANFDVATGAYSHSTNEDTPVSGQVVASDADGNPLSYTAGTSPAHGSVTVNPDGTWTYTPGSNFNGTDVFTVTISDGQGGISTATVNVGVTAVNDAPVASADSASVLEGGSVAINLVGNDGDVEGALDPASIVITSAPTHGTVSVNANGTVSYQHNGSETAADSFSYTVKDAQGLVSAPVNVSVSVTGVNDLPVVDTGSANFDVATGAYSHSTNEDTPVSGQVVASDADGNPLSYTAGTSPAHGSVTVNPDGTWTYTPGSNFNGTDVFTVTISDGQGGISTATVNVGVTAVNDAPVASADSASVLEGGSVVINLVGNDGDVEGSVDPASIVITSAPTHGTVSVNANGTVSYQHDGSETAADSFSYTVKDAQGLVSAPVSVSVSVTGANDLPVVDTGSANFDVATGAYSHSTTEDTPVSGQVVASDADGNPLSYTAGTAPAHGSVTVNPDGTWTYTPGSNFNGSDSFTVAISDGQGGISTATVNVGVTAVNDAPVASADSASVLEGGSVVINLVGNDGDVEGSVDPASIVITSAPTHGTVSVNANGTVSYQHDGSETAADSFSYTVKDAQGLVSAPVNVSVSVTGVNDLPVVDTGSANFDVATGAYSHSTNEDTPVSGQVVASDADGNPLSYTAGTAPAHGSVTVNPDGTWTYTPGSNFNGSDSFTVTISDGQGGISIATVNVGVTAVNDAPVANNDSLSTTEDTAVTYTAAQLLGNDTDIDSATLSIASVASGSGGSAVLNADGSVTFTPNAHFNGTADFSYIVTDGTSNSTPATATVQVAAINDAPVASADSASVLEGGSVVINLVSNDGDVEGALDPASIVITSAPTHGTVSVNANGTVSYQHDGSETAADSFSYTVKDAQGLVSAPVNVSIAVTGSNDLPVVDTGSANFDPVTGSYQHSTTEDTPVSGQVVASDADGNPLSYTAGTAPAHGSVTINPDGTWTYTPGSNFNGTDVFTVTISDGQGGISTATVNVGVTAVNDAPVASADSASVLEGGSVVINLVSNDGDVEGALDPASIVITSAPTHGTVSVNANGTVSYQHNGSETAADSFSYTVKDAQGLVSAPVSVSVSVTGANDLPVVDTGSANFDVATGAYSHSTTEDTPVSGQVVASDADGNPLSYTAGTAPAHGSVTVNPDGTWTYTPGSNFNGTDVFTVTISDGQGGISTATVNVGVTAVNDAPVASADSASVLEGGSVVINLVGNDGDVEGSVDPASIVITSAPTHGTVSVNANGTVSYQHNGSETAADSFSYTVKDAQGLVSAPVNVSVSVTGVNDLPVVDTGSANFDVATGAYSHSTNEDTPVSGQVVASDADGNPLSYTAGTAPAHGSVTVNPDGTWTYTPGSNFNGSDSFTVTISDGQGGISIATVNVGVTAVNDAPVANNDSLSTTEDTAVTYTAAQLLGNDTDIDSATLSIASVASGSGGSAVLNADGSVTFTPNAHFNGTADFSYIVTDGTSNSTPATATVQVAAINDAPVASADSASVLEGGSVVINLVSNDGDVEGALDPASIVITSAPTHGTVSVNANGTVSYQHDGSETAADSFSYTVKDAQGLVSAPVNVSIAVTGSNDLPVVDTGSANFDPVTGSYQHSTTEDTPVSGQVVASDADGNPLSYTAGTAPAHGSVTINPDGTWTYTPGSNFNGTDVFTVTISDGQGGISTATVNVGVTAVNDAPVASADSASVLEGGSVVINLVSNDGDVEGALDPASIVITNAPTHGTVSVNANGTVSYQHDGSETAADSFSYTVKDAQGLVSAPVSVSVSVTGVNDLPVVDTGSANFDVATGAYSHSTNEDTPVSGQVVASDADGNPLSYTAGTSPAHGSVTVNPDGTWTYTPGSNFNGTDVFTVTISDGQGGISTATVNVGVTAVNDAPVANNDSLSTTEDTAVTYTAAQLLGNDTDIDSATLSIASVASGSGGSAVLNADGSVTFTPNAHFNGTADFSYIVTDGTSNSTPATATVQVAAINDAPVASADSASVLEGGSVVINLVSNDGDVEGALDPASIVITNAPTHGTVSVNANGTVSYQHDGSETAADSFSYTVKDAQGLVSAPVSVSVSVTGVNDLPVVDTGSANFDVATGAYSHSTTEDTPVSGQVVASDADGNPLSYTAGTAPAHGSVTVNPDGTWTYTPGSNFNGTDVFTVTISDGQGGISTATVNVGVTAVNDAPVASADSASVLEGGSVVINLVGNDGDVEGSVDPASIVITSAPTHGTVSVNANGTVSYQHDGSETAADSFSYTVKDAQGLVSAPVSVSVSVTGANDLPVVDTGSANFDVATGAYSHSTTEDTPVSGQVVASDADGNPLSYTAGTAPAHGSVTVNPDGTWTYTPGSNFNGSDSFTVAISDGQGGISTATVNVGVTAVNDAPVASADSASVLEGGSVVINLVSNDGDVEGALDPASIVITSAPTHGTVSVNANGTVSYQHNGSETAADSFSYTVKDAQGLVSAPVNVSVSVTGVNDLPVVDTGSANFDVATGAYSHSTNEDTPVSGQVVASDADGNPLSYTAGTSPAHGSVTVNPDGTWTYTPGSNFNGTDVFTVTISDGQGGISTATVNVGVTAVNDAPVANNDSLSTTEDTAVTYTAAQLLGNDTDIDSATLSIASVASGSGGSAVLNADGSVTFTPNAHFNGTADFSYIVTDGTSNSTPATATVQVAAINDAPVASADSASVLEGGSVVINLVSNDGDVEGALDPASIVITNAPTHGTVSVNANGTVSYQHDGSETAADSFSYTVKDAQGLVSAPVSVSVSVTGVNDLPVVDTGSANFDVATGAYSHSTTEDTPVSGQVVASDADGNPLSYTAGTAPAHGSVTVNPDGTWTYTPGSNFNGTDVFTVTISDGQGGISTATVNVGVTAVNDAPVASADSASVLEGGSVVINLVSNDGDVEGALDPASIVITSAPTHGTVSVNANGTVSYQHNGSETAADSFSYTVKDAQGLVSAPVNVSVSVTGVNDLPVVDTGSANFDVATGAYSHSTNEDTPVSGQVVASDADGNPLSYTAGTSPAHGSVTVNPDGTWTYTPGSNFNGTDVFTVTISDGQGGISTATVNVGVTAVNDAPVANNDSLSTTEDTAVTYTAAQLVGNDTDIDSTNLTIASVTAGSGGSVVLNADGTVTFTPNANFNGTADFTYTVTDGVLTSEPATVTVAVSPVNDAPVASADSATTAEDTPVIIDVLANDTDVDGPALSIKSATVDPAQGSVSIVDGKLVFTPASNFAGSATITYVSTDGSADSVPTAVTVTVTPVNDTPTANNDSLTAVEDTAVTYAAAQLLGNDTDIDSTNLKIASVTAGNGGSVVLNANGTVTFTPNANFTGTADFTYTVTDGELSSAPATVTVAVSPVNDAPVAANQAKTTAEDTPVTGKVVASDVDGDTLSYAVQSGAAHGTLALNTTTGDYTYTPAANYNGTDSFTVRVSDGKGGFVDSIVNVTITPVNDAPVVTSDNATIPEDTVATGNVLSNDSDVEGSALTVTQFSINGTTYAAGSVADITGVGTVTIQTNGDYTFTPVANWSGSAPSVVYTATDGSDASTGLLALKVTPVADVPTLNAINNIYMLLEGNTTISTGSSDTPVTRYDSGAGVSQGNLELELGVASGYLDNRFDPTGQFVNDPGFVNIIDGKVSESHFSLHAGTTVTWDYSFTNGEDLSSEVSGGFNDVVVLLVTDPLGNKQSILVDASEAKFPQKTSNSSFSYTSTMDGSYTFQWLVLNSGDDYKDSSLSLNNLHFTLAGDTTRYTVPVELPIMAALRDTDGSETLSVTIGGVPTGIKFDAGVNNGNGTWTFTAAQLADLHLLAPENYQGTLNLTVTATATETATGDTASASQSFTVTIAETTNTFTTSGETSQTINGTNGNDLLRGYAGNDVINAGAGNDIAYGGAGADTLNGDTGNDVLYGGVGNDRLNGGLGQDKLVGGTGNDTLTGGDGNDVFRWEFSDAGTAGSPYNDIITDFNTAALSAGGDVLDLRDLLQGELNAGTNVGNLDSFLRFETVGSNTLLHISSTGAYGSGGYAAAKDDQTITLQGVDLSNNNSLSSEQIIQNLLTAGKLITD